MILHESLQGHHERLAVTQSLVICEAAARRAVAIFFLRHCEPAEGGRGNLIKSNGEIA